MPNLFADCPDRVQLIFQLVGACSNTDFWPEPSKVFDEQKAIDLANAACERLEELEPRS